MSKEVSKSAKSKPPPEPMTVGKFVIFSCCGGQVAYLLATGLYTAITGAVLGDDVAARMDSLFLPAGSPPRRALDAAQFAVRTYVAGCAVVAGTSVLVIAVGAVVGVGALYLWLNGPGESFGSALLARYRRDRWDIPVLYFGVGAPLGWLLWTAWDASPLGAWSSVTDSIYVIVCCLVAAAVSLWKLADTQQKAADAARRKKNDSALANALGDTTIGTVSVDGGPARDVTARDAVAAVASALSGPEARAAAWAAGEDVPAMKLARVAAGALHGFAARVVWQLGVLGWVVPAVSQLLGGERTALYVFWQEGMRAWQLMKN